MEVYQLTVSQNFAAAHRLREYEGKCAALHGHNFKVEVTVAAVKLNELGMALDFGQIKEALARVLEQLDHSYLNDLAAFSHKNPTSENMPPLFMRKFLRKLSPLRLAR